MVSNGRPLLIILYTADMHRRKLEGLDNSDHYVTAIEFEHPNKAEKRLSIFDQPFLTSSSDACLSYESMTTPR